jgi:hypothetical protein
VATAVPPMASGSVAYRSVAKTTGLVKRSSSSTARPVAWTRINRYRFACGRIAEGWSELDSLGRSRQPVAAAGTPVAGATSRRAA